MKLIPVVSIIRIGLGVASYVAPDFTAKQMGLDENPQTAAVTRIFGTREIALGVATLASKGPLRTKAIYGGIAIDAFDALAGGLALKEGRFPVAKAAGQIAPALLAVVAGILDVRNDRQASALAKTQLEN